MTMFQHISRLLNPLMTRALVVLTALGLGASAAQASLPVKKNTRFENLTITPIAVHAGETINCSTTLYYQDKQGKYKPLGYKNVDVEWRIGNTPLTVTKTKGGVANWSFQIPPGTRPGKYTVKAIFYGDIELKQEWISHTFTVLR